MREPIQARRRRFRQHVELSCAWAWSHRGTRRRSVPGLSLFTVDVNAMPVRQVNSGMVRMTDCARSERIAFADNGTCADATGFATDDYGVLPTSRNTWSTSPSTLCVR